MPKGGGSTGTLIGETLAGYRVEALIGRGAMGSVYLARDTRLNRSVALKVLLGSLARSPDVVREFHREAQSAAPLRHEGIVRIYEAGSFEGTPYIAMEYVNGEPLDRFLRRKGKLDWGVAFHIAAKVADALQCAHEHGIVHRDVKPANIMLDHGGGIRLTDFGIAAAQHGDAPSPAGPVIGTPQYMSPEQVTGKEVGPASDLFALGVVLYQMISGEMPFVAEDSVALVNRICESDPIRLNKLDLSIPDDVARLVAYLLEKDPASRPASGRVAASIMRRVQKQGGERSVLSESLNAFIKEAMEPRAVSGAPTPKPGASVKRRSGTTAVRRGGIHISARSVARVVAALLLVTGAAVVGPLVSATRPVSDAPPAPGLPGARFVDRSHELRVTLPLPGYRLAQVQWIDAGVVLVRAERYAADPTAGIRSGWLAVDLNNAAVVSLSSPDNRASVRNNTHLRVAPARGRQGDSLAGAFVVAGALPSRRGVTILRQDWRVSVPDTTAIVEFDRALWPSQSALAIRPGGTAFAAIVMDGGGERDGIVELPTGTYMRVAAPELETGPGAPIIPHSLSYSASGQWVVFSRGTPDTLYEWWILRSDTPGESARRVLSGLADPIVALRATDDLAAVSRYDAAQGSVIDLIDVQTGRSVAALGPGSVSADAWSTSGDTLAYLRNADESASMRELWAVTVKQPGSAWRVVDAVTGAYAFSPDGAWLAVALDTEPPQLSFLRWNAAAENP